MQDKAFSNDERIRNEMAKRRSQVPEANRPRRLIRDSDYDERMKLAMAAEQGAKQNKRELWSEAEMKRWNPPADAQMLNNYSDHKPWFKDIASLVDADPRLAELSRDPNSWKRARRSCPG
jgi:hypothetical protein